MKFPEFPKIPRLSRDVVITEKLDGTNASVFIAREAELGVVDQPFIDQMLFQRDGVGVWAGSRTRWLSPNKTKEKLVGNMKLTAPDKALDNFGFAVWVQDHAAELIDALGVGHHFGEWWGLGIQRGYGLSGRRFSLFNTARWGEHAGGAGRVGPCYVVPTLYSGPMEVDGRLPGLNVALRELRMYGSAAAPGFLNPEGVVMYHKASGQLFKKTLDGDEAPKSKGEKQ